MPAEPVRLRFTIPGVPVGKGRPRADARIVWKNGKPEAVVVIRTPKETVAAEKVVLAEFRRKYPKVACHTGPVMLRFTAVFPIPTSWPKRVKEACRAGTVYHTSVPDKDNIEKLIVDALSAPKRKPGAKFIPSLEGFPWADDAQVIGGGVKVYGEVPRIDVVLEMIADADTPATPAQKRAEARVTASERGTPQIAPNRTPHKPQSKKGAYPSKLQAAIDAALAKGGDRP